MHRYDDYVPERTMSADKVKITDKNGLSGSGSWIGYISRASTNSFYFENASGSSVEVLKYEDWNIEYIK